MTEEFDLQCERCGTIYSNLEDVCPYCGEPQPLEYENRAILPDTPHPDYAPAGNFYQDQSYPGGYASEDEAYYPAGEGEFPEDELEGQDLDYDEYAEDEPDANYLAGPAAYEEEFDELGDYEAFPEYADHGRFEDDLDNEAGLEAEPQSRRFTRRRTALGCLSVFLCVGLLYGGIGILAAYHGLQEQASDKQTEAQTHYERGQEHLTNNSLDLAIAEFELALSLNPGLIGARESLREARRIAQAKPTPTSETRSAAAASIMEKAETEVAEKKWPEAAETLAQIRDLDPNYRSEQVSELIYTANYQLGLQLVTSAEIDQALLAFERALAEQPNDPQATAEQTKAMLYVAGKAAESTDKPKAIEAFSQLYHEDAAYLDVKESLLAVYEQYGDELIEQGQWCLAEAQFLAANRLKPGGDLQAKADTSTQQCNQTQVADASGASPPVPPIVTAIPSSAGPAVAATKPGVAPPKAANPAPTGLGGSIYFSAFNTNEQRWEILAVPAGGGSPRVVALNGTMPSVSPDGRWLVYHSELIDAEGFHRFDLTSGEDARITQLQRHILPRWGSDSSRFLLTAQEPGTGRWQVLLGFADGKSDPLILRDGRTPDWSTTNLIAYQGTDPAGNNPGIYVVPFDGGEETRLTTHQSDRSPEFSPDGSQMAYMSTKGGNWDIYTVSTAGSAPKQITTSPAQDGLPAWSPDGSQIAYVSDSAGGWAIYVVNAAGGTPTKITPWDGTHLPDWLLAQIWWAR